MRGMILGARAQLLSITHGHRSTVSQQPADRNREVLSLSRRVDVLALAKKTGNAPTEAERTTLAVDATLTRARQQHRDVLRAYVQRRERKAYLSSHLSLSYPLTICISCQRKIEFSPRAHIDKQQRGVKDMFCLLITSREARRTTKPCSLHR